MSLGVEIGARYVLSRFTESGGKRFNYIVDPNLTKAGILSTLVAGTPGQWEPTSFGTVEGRGRLTGKKDNNATARSLLTTQTTETLLTAGTLYTAQMDIEVVDAPSVNCDMYIDWYNGASYLSTSGVAPAFVGTGSTTLSIAPVAAPATANKGVLVFRANSAVALDTVDVYMDRAIFQPYVAGQTSYFDGSTTGAKWTGTANFSASSIPLLERAVFNDSSDPDFVGSLSPETSGLDSPDIREDASDLVEDDGGTHGNFYTGRRPVVLQGTIIASSPTQRNERADKLRVASRAFRDDATLSWEPAGGPTGGVMITKLRRQQPFRITKGYVKDFQIPLVAADPRIYAALAKSTTKTWAGAEEGLSSTRAPVVVANSALGGGTVEWTSPENAKVATGGGAGLASLPELSGEKLTKALLSSSNGFSIPAEAIILGIECKANVWINPESPTNGPGWGTVQMVKAGALAGENKAIPTVHSWTNNQEWTWGGAADLWATTWTPAQINASNFGLALVAKHFVAQAPAKIGAGVDWFNTKVFYKVGTEVHTQTVTNSGDNPTRPKVFVKGSTTPTWTVENLTTGGSLTVTKKLTTPEEAEIDFANFTIKRVSDGLNLYSFVTFSPTSWWELAPGANELVLPASSQVVTIWNDAWM